MHVSRGYQEEKGHALYLRRPSSLAGVSGMSFVTKIPELSTTWGLSLPPATLTPRPPVGPYITYIQHITHTVCTCAAAQRFKFCFSLVLKIWTSTSWVALVAQLVEHSPRLWVRTQPYRAAHFGCHCVIWLAFASRHRCCNNYGDKMHYLLNLL